MATNIYVDNGTSLLIGGEVGADYAFSVEGLANAAGQVSAQINLGIAPRQHTYKWSCEVQFQATPTQGASLDLYYATAPDGDSTQIDGDIGSSDAALGDTDSKRNLTFFASVISENAAASEKCVASGTITILDRYLTIVAINESGAAVNATDTNFRFDIQPKQSQGQ